jgi:hypothetical protein
MTGEVPRFRVWQCVGCGRIEDPQPCVGICRDVKAEFVPAQAHDEALARAHEEIDALRAIVRRIAGTTPRDGQWEGTWRALQKQAREALSKFPAR